MSYQLLKSLHLFGVVLFLGNIVITAAWKAAADQSRNATIIAYAQRLVTITDIVFTAPGAVLILVTGLLMAGSHAAVLETYWLRWGVALFVLSGLVWLLLLLPIQYRQARLARRFGEEGIAPSYWRLARLWAVFGTIATLLPLANLYFMVFKPLCGGRGIRPPQTELRRWRWRHSAMVFSTRVMTAIKASREAAAKAPVAL